MSTMIFEWKEDKDGIEGWVAAGYENFNAVAINQFGHDCIEHFPRGQRHGAIADELLALGARLFIRVGSGWWMTQRDFPKPEFTWASELETLLRDMEDDSNACLPEWAKPAPPAGEHGAIDLESIIQAALVKTVPMANEYLFNGDPDNDDKPFTLESRLIVRMGDWLRRGVHACRARYKDKHPDDIMWLQLQLDEAMQRYQTGESGQRLIVRIHERDMEYHITHKGPAYW